MLCIDKQTSKKENLCSQYKCTIKNARFVANSIQFNSRIICKEEKLNFFMGLKIIFQANHCLILRRISSRCLESVMARDILLIRN